MRLRFLLLLPLLATPASAAGVGPAPGPLRIIGAGTGCIAGAQALPPEGNGYEVIRASQSSFWGAPVTLRGIERLGAEAQRAGLAELYVGDLSGPRGGPLSGGHIAHQRGLDVDIYLDTLPKQALSLEQRNGLVPPSLVPAGSTQVDPSEWSATTIALIHMATALPGLDRLLVNPAIKRQLCAQVTGDRSWLRQVRPWWGHRAHMHLHFACPPGQSECVDQAPVPAGDGCGAGLAWWFMPDGSIRPPPPSSGPPPAIPAACDPILAPVASAGRPLGAEAN